MLVPLDGTPFAEGALPAATALAGALDGELVLHRAVPYPPALLTPEAILAATLEEDLDRDRVAAEDDLIHLAGPLVRTGRPTRIDVRLGLPVETIVAAASEHGAAFTVMATHGRGGLGRALLGSVADAVLRRGATPLLLVRPRASGDDAVEAAAEAIETAPGPRLVLELDQDEVVLLRRALQTFAEAVAPSPGPGQLPARTERLLARLASEEGVASAPPPSPSLAGVA